MIPQLLQIWFNFQISMYPSIVIELFKSFKLSDIRMGVSADLNFASLYISHILI